MSQGAHIIGLRVAHESVVEANRRREVAIDAVVDFALRALIDGEPLDAVMDACDFQPGTSTSMFGVEVDIPRQQAFAQWLGQNVCNRVLAAAAK